MSNLLEQYVDVLESFVDLNRTFDNQADAIKAINEAIAETKSDLTKMDSDINKIDEYDQEIMDKLFKVYEERNNAELIMGDAVYQIWSYLCDERNIIKDDDNIGLGSLRDTTLCKLWDAK